MSTWLSYVYVLKCPKSGEIRYVGQTASPRERFIIHICSSKNGYSENERLADWINSLLSEGLEPVMEVVNYCTRDKASFMEQRYFLKYMGNGLLLNKRSLYDEWLEIDRELLKQIIKKKKVSLKDIGIACNLSTGTVRNILRGKTYGITIKKGRLVQSYILSLLFPASGTYTAMYPPLIR